MEEHNCLVSLSRRSTHDFFTVTVQALFERTNALSSMPLSKKTGNRHKGQIRLCLKPGTRSPALMCAMSPSVFCSDIPGQGL